jgi:GT2 family glycosyltransferase
MLFPNSDSLKKKCLAIIPSIEGWHLLSRLLPTIDLPKEQIFVVDQGSRDGTEQKCRELGYGCIQMHSRATFVAAVNRGIKEALDRGAEYILILNNDIEFVTSVASQLLSRMEEESNIGALAPRQITVVDNQPLHDVKRGKWNLTELSFSHDYDVNPHNSLLNKIGPSSATHFKFESEEIETSSELLEADFCEFTCVLIKGDVFRKVGLLTDKYEFYHEDAEFCYRCQMAGYRCVYDQTGLIKHYVGSTFDQQKLYDKFKLIQRNKKYFADDFLGFHVRFPFIPPTIASSWSTTNEFLWTYLRKYGLLASSSNAPTLSSIAHPEDVNTDYLLSVWETSQIPASWATRCKAFKHIFVPSSWNKDSFEQSGYKNTSVLPFGIEPDIFNPWGTKLTFPWAKSILCVFQNQYRKGLDVTLAMWNQLRAEHPNVFLVMYGKGIKHSQLGFDKQYATRMGNFIVSIDWERQIALLQPAFLEHVSHAEMAILYRSCDLFLLNSRSEGFGYPVIEAMACGKVCVIPNYGATKEFIKGENCLHFEGSLIKADYKDKGFTDIGEWWEPSIADLSLKVQQALAFDAESRAAMGKAARQSVLTRYTWRHSMMALRRELQKLQITSSHALSKGFSSQRLQKQMASLMHSTGKNFIKASVVMEQYGFMGVALKTKAKILKKLRDKFSKT